MSIPKVSSDFISSVLNSYYANKGGSKNEISDSSKNEAGSSKSVTKDYKANSSKNDEDGPSRSEKTSSSKYEDSDFFDAYSSSKDYKDRSNKDYDFDTDSRQYDEYSSSKDYKDRSNKDYKNKSNNDYDDDDYDKTDSRRYDAYNSSQDDRSSSSKDYKTRSNKDDKSDASQDDRSSSSKDYKTRSNKDDKSDTRQYDAYSQDDRSSASKDYAKSKPAGKYDDYKDGLCTMEEDAYYDKMYPTYDAYDEYPSYPGSDYPPPHGDDYPPPHGLPRLGPFPPRGPFPPMGFPRPPMPGGPHHAYPRGPPGSHNLYPRGPPRHPPSFNERDGPRHGPPDNRYNDQRNDRAPKRRYDDDDDKQSRYPKKFASEKSAKELFDFDKLPKDLTDMFTAATCNLCLVTLHQPGLMELHYRGKNHIKRMKGWLYKYTGEQHTLTAVEIEQIDSFDMKPKSIPGVELVALPDGSIDGDYDVTYCKLCNIPISSAVVAKQHYTGKKHMKALRDSLEHGGSKPPVDSLSNSNDNTPKPNVVFNHKLYCHVCKVSCSNEEQYETHLVGKRHKKAWKATQVLAPMDLQNISQSKHRPINYEIDPELTEDYELSLYCIRCQEYFTIAAEFTYHSCPESELLCKKCKTRFDSKPEHKYHDCPLDHYCDKCDECFDSVDDVAKHECGKGKGKNQRPGMVGLDGSYQCTLCRKSMNSVLSLDMHGKSRLHCALLHKLTEYYPDLPSDFNPIKTLPKLVYHCEKCDINFKDDEELDTHMKQGTHSIRIGVPKLENAPPSSSDGQRAVATGGLGNFPPVLDKMPTNGAGLSGAAVNPIGKVGEYDIRNIDVNELLKGYKK